MAFAAHESARTLKRIELPDHDLKFAPLEVVQHPPRWIDNLGKVVLFADNHHFDPVTGEGGREGLRDALIGIGAKQVEVVAAEHRELTAEDMEGADLLVIYHTQRKSSEKLRGVLGDWVDAGRPLLVAHCGIGAYDDWPPYRQWIGRHWVWGDEVAGTDQPPSGHPHVTCDLHLVPDSGFALAYDSAWLPRDEVYTDLVEAGPVVDFVTGTYDGDKHASIAWKAEGIDNVMVWAPGHRRDIWSLEAMRAGLAASIKTISR